jgi:hypothetical protein
VPLTGGLLTILLVGGLLFVRDVMAVRQSLETSRISLDEVRSALGSVNVTDAHRALREADDALGVARSRAGGPLWSLASILPVAGDSVEVIRGVVEVASASVDVAQVVVDDGSDLVAGGIDVAVQDGQLELAPLEDARAILDALPVARLGEARDRLAASEPRWAPEELRNGRTESLTLADEAIRSADRASALLEALPGFLGAEGPRRYFLGVQTPGELRGTGGLIGYWAVLEVDDGRFTLGEASVYDALDDVRATEQGTNIAPGMGRIGQLSGDPFAGVPTTPAFAERYGHAAAGGLFSNVNVDPDLPTTARVALDLFAQRTDQQLDGMLLVDPIAMQGILEAIGQPVPMPAGIADDVLPTELAPEEFARFVTVDVYDVLGDGEGDRRKPLLQGLGDAAFARVFDGAWDGVAVSRALATASSGRHLQVFSEDVDEQAAFSRIGITGELIQPEDADLLAVTANNAVGGKQDVHLGHATQAVIELTDPLLVADGTVEVERHTQLRVTVDNPLPAEGLDTYIIGNCLVGDERSRCFDGPPGHNRTWFSVWTPGQDVLQAAQRAEGPAGVRTGLFNDLSVVDHYLETAAESSAWFELGFTGPVTVERDRDTLIYRLAWWHQSKAIPDLLDLTVSMPEDWQAVAANVTGGGDGLGMGPEGDGTPLLAETHADGTASLTGTVSADATLEVRFERVPD